MADTPPRAPRSSVILYAHVRASAGEAECRVRNLSVTGACIDNTLSLAPGDRAVVTMGTLTDVAAEVMWTHGTLAGMQFARQIDLAAARVPRKRTTTTITAGWMEHIHHAYRR